MKLYLYILIGLFIGCKQTKSQTKTQKLQPKLNKMTDFKNKTEEEWKSVLTDKQFHILREAGTEHPGTSEYNDFSELGTFVCVACDTPLYLSETKFNAHCGWPSFDASIEKNIILDVDHKVGYARTELRCKTCDGHLGHVFDDGPTETGKRHCLNGTALKFIPKVSTSTKNSK